MLHKEFYITEFYMKEFFKIALRLRDRHVSVWQSGKILNVFNTLTLKQSFWKKNTLFQLKAPRLKKHHYHTKLSYQKPMLTQIEWWIQNGSKNGVSPVAALFLWKFCFSLRTFQKELICCTKNSNIHIHDFRKSWCFIWGYSFRKEHATILWCSVIITSSILPQVSDEDTRIICICITMRNL